MIAGVTLDCRQTLEAGKGKKGILSWHLHQDHRLVFKIFGHGTVR